MCGVRRALQLAVSQPWSGLSGSGAMTWGSSCWALLSCDSSVPFGIVAVGGHQLRPLKSCFSLLL